MITYSTLLNSPDSFEEVVKLIEKSFNYNDKHSYSTDFSPLMNSTNWQNLHILKDEQRVIAHIGARIVKTVNNIPLLLLGGIAVEKEHQGEGHFSELFEKVINLYKDEVALVMLWSDLDGLYKKFNFHEAGVLIQTGDEEFTDEKAVNLGFKKLPLAHLGADKLSQLRKCFESSINNQFVSVQRSPMDWGAVATISSTDLYVHEENELIDFYFFINKGMDLKNIIHEFAGLNNVVTNQSLEKLKPFKTWTPSKNPWFKGDAEKSIFMGLFRIGRPELFSQLIYIWSDGEITLTGVSDESIVFHFDGMEYTQSHGEFLSLLMGPERAEEFMTFSKELWITGIDSI